MSNLTRSACHEAMTTTSTIRTNNKQSCVRKINVTLTAVIFAFLSCFVCPAFSLQLHNVGVASQRHDVNNKIIIAGKEGTVLPYNNNNNNRALKYETRLFSKKRKHSSNTALEVSGGDSSSSAISTIPSKVKKFAQKNSFLLGMAVAVSFAKAFPSLGRTGGALRPELFIGKFGVMFIFLISGLSLELSELTEAFSNMKLNLLTQLTSFFAWPLLAGLPLVYFFKKIFPSLLPPALVDGLFILTCLPTTVNMCILLTSSAGGNVATALCNAVIGNILGIFVTPALLLRFFGTNIELPFVDMIFKLSNKVLFPVVMGQLLRLTPTKDFYLNHKKRFKTVQELLLTGIVWNAFCNAFAKGLGLDVQHAVILITLLPLLHLSSLAALFTVFSSKFLNFSREQTVAATLCASHKTLAFGLPLINTVFEGNPNLAAYCAPIMIIHPTQLILGSLLVPKFAAYISQKKEEQK